MRDTGNEVEMCHTILQDATQKDQFRYNKVQPEKINRPQHEAMGITTVCGVYSPSLVYCFRMNFNMPRLGYS